MKNFVIISPHFPDTFHRFVQALKNNGFRTLGIGDSPYDKLPKELYSCLDEYYGCWDMGNFENEVKAVRYFEEKYGHIDYLESNNEFWLERDAKLRDIFHIDTGVGYEKIQMYQHKSLMKEGYKKAGAKTAAFILIDTFENALKFAKKVGYPIFIKPDYGVGAQGDFKIKNEEDLKHFFEVKDSGTTYICEQYITGNIISFDGVADSNSNVVFCASNFFPPSIADVVEEHKDVFYYTLPEVPKDLLKLGKKVVKAFEVKKRFFHMEFFRLTEDAPGVGKVGDIVPLETNMRPAGGYTPDLINFANSVNCYQIWADVMAFDEVRHDYSGLPHYFAGCASRRDEHAYVNSDEEVLAKYKDKIAAHGRYAKVIATAMGDRYFMGKFDTIKEMEEFRDFVELRK
ncbi:MAG: ATP-grasp domain-containing protein [Bacilli bacterium]|nr:ATP-grasp domain-containing protein [Bacilli bacterium]